MLEWIFVSLLQVAAGAPAAVQADQTPQTQPAAAPTGATQSNAEAEDGERRCRIRRVTGTRLQSVVTCRNGARSGHQDQDTRDAMHTFQRPAGTNEGG
jgi:hypothetical protein